MKKRTTGLDSKREAVRKEENAVNEKRTAAIHNLLIVDESGSMKPLRADTLNGISEAIGSIKSAQKAFKDTQRHFVTLVSFSSGRTDGEKTVRTLFDDIPVGEFPNGFKAYNPSGCTPLYDAIGFSLARLEERILEDQDATGVVTIMTDGLENASREWTPGNLREKINKLKERGWTFSYMGSCHNVKDVTDLLNIDNAIEFRHDSRGTKSSWDLHMSSQTAYYQKMDKLYHEGSLSKKEELDRKRQMAREFQGKRMTPDDIKGLGDNQVYVHACFSRDHPITD